MAKDFYIRTMTAGRFTKAVQYKRSLPSDSKQARREKTAATVAGSGIRRADA